MKKLLIKNIKSLLQVEDEKRERIPGKEMDVLNQIENAWLAVEDDIIVDFGSMKDWPGISDWSDLEVIEASGKYVLPTWCDSHTHLVFAAPREGEFVDRIKGLTYQEIAAKGGGILNSAKKLQETSEEKLYESTKKRLDEIMRTGTGAVEIKSGYGLTAEAELKMLRVIKKLKAESPLTIKATFLGAHALPQEYKTDRTAYLNLMLDEVLPQIAKVGLADYIDVFCETNYYTPQETERILEAGKKYKLPGKIHTNQFTSIGGIEAAVKHNALSVDHLEVMKDSDFNALKNSNTIATLLPSCSFFLNIPYAPAKQLMKENITVALASDYNPGSTPSGNMPFVLSLATIKMKMTPEAAINAATLNGAAAMQLNNSLGSIARGKKANLILTREIPSYAFMMYSFGANTIESVILGGKVQF